MLLSKLELQGFKSFANKVEIRFEKGITAIIGPNGSGKSNIAEAMRWVLGEQSARSLRGAKMEDIIFNGTVQKRPQAYCEVQLTMLNDDHLLPIDFSEVNITRRVYRSGQSEYFINRAPCRLRDVLELFRDTGIGKDGYSIIGQGRIDSILSNRSEERREVFEEAAGITKYRVRKEEAARKLEQTRQNLLRIEDILENLRERLGPLEEQSETARQYLRLREELKGIELNLFLHQYDRLSSRIAQQDEAVSQLEAETTARQSRTESLNAEAARQQERAAALEETAARLQKELLELTRQVEQQDGETRLLSEKIDGLSREKDAAQKTERDAAEKESALAAQSEENAAAQREKRAQLSKLEKDVETRSEELSGRLRRIEQQEAEAEAQKSRMMEAMNRLSAANAQVSRLDAMLETIRNRQSALDGERETLEKEGAELAAERTQAEAGLDEAKQQKAQLAAAREEKRQALAAAEEALRQGETQQRSLEQERAALSSRLNVLREMKAGYEGYYSSVRNFLRDCKKQPQLSAGIVGVVAQLIRVPEKLETALEMAVGSALQNIVTEDETSAKRAIEYLRRQRYGRATFLPLTAIRGRTLTESERRCLNEPGCLGVASELVDFEERFRPVVENLLGRTVVAETMDAAIAIARRSRQAFRIATLEGDIINPGGSMTGGSVQKKEFSLLGREREIEQCQKRAAALLSQQEEAKRAAAAQAERMEALRKEQTAVEQHGAALDVELARQNERMHTLLHLLSQNGVQRQKKEQEAGQIAQTAEDVCAQREEILKLQTSLSDQQTASQEDVAQAHKALSAMREERETLLEALSAQRIALAGAQQEISALAEEEARITKERAQLAQTLRQAKERQAQATEQIETLSKAHGAAGETVLSLRKQADERTAQLSRLETEREQARRHAKELEQQADTLREEAGVLTEKRHQAELNREKAALELSTLQNRIWEEYELTYEGALAYRKEMSFTSSQRQTDQIKKEIRALGDVNVNAIEDYQNIKERHDALFEQQQDLIKAEADLSRLIEELLSTMRRQFKEQIARLNGFFKETFAELFEGGTAELRLPEGEDVLSCDVEIIAQPPGKKLQLLSLLSGGERALTAIALLFSMLRHKPMPFCVLDEIEASLDDANVDHYASYLKRYCQNTQFILITHRKGSMAVSDALYGVAMEEKGVSKLVSVRLEDAKEPENAIDD